MDTPPWAWFCWRFLPVKGSFTHPRVTGCLFTAGCVIVLVSFTGCVLGHVQSCQREKKLQCMNRDGLLRSASVSCTSLRFLSHPAHHNIAGWPQTLPARVLFKKELRTFKCSSSTGQRGKAIMLRPNMSKSYLGVYQPLSQVSQTHIH